MGRQGSDPGPFGPCVRAGTAVTLGLPGHLVPLCGRRKVMERVIITGVDRSTHSRADSVTVGIDARDPASGAVGLAFEAARSRGVRLHAVHAWAPPAQAAERPFPALEEDRAIWEDDEVQRLSDALRSWRGKYPEVDVLADVVLLAPEVALAHAAGNSGLVVAGRRSGRTALALLPAAGCPVMVVPV